MYSLTKLKLPTNETDTKETEFSILLHNLFVVSIKLIIFNLAMHKRIKMT